MTPEQRTALAYPCRFAFETAHPRFASRLLLQQETTMGELRRPNMVEPTDPEERAAAIRICRANSHLDIHDGHRLSPLESDAQWKNLADDIPYEKWIWLWNHGQQEWDPGFTRTSEAKP